MSKERDIAKILSHLQIQPDDKAKQKAYDRMMARRTEILAVKSKAEKAMPIQMLSLDDLQQVAAAGDQIGHTEANNKIDKVEDEFGN